MLYLSVFADAVSFLGCEESEVVEADSLTVRKVDVTMHLTDLILHQSLVRNAMYSEHVSISVLIGIKLGCNIHSSLSTDHCTK